MRRFTGGTLKAGTWLRLGLVVTLTTCLLNGAAYAASAKLVDVDLDGEPDEIHVETDFYSGVIDLTRNGQFSKLVYKPTDTNFSGAQYYWRYYYPGNDWILPKDPFKGHRGTPAQEKAASRMLMEGKVEQVNAKTVRLIAEGYCPDIFGMDWFSDIKVQRVVIMRDGQRTIEFEYTVTNNNDKPRGIYLSKDHGIDCRHQEAEAYVPRTYGVSMQDNNSHGSDHKYLDHQQANWWGVLKRNGTGAVETFDGTWLGRCLVHAKASAGFGLRQEVRPRLLEPGQSQTWKYTLAGLHGLNSLNAAAPGIIMGLEFREDAKPAVWEAKAPKPGASIPVFARLLSDTSRTLKVELRHCDGSGKELSKQTKTVKLSAHKLALVTFSPVKLAGKSNVFYAKVHEGDRELTKCYESFDASGKGLVWNPKEVNPLPLKGDPLRYKNVAKHKPLPMPGVDLSVTTEHVAWAKPHVKGTAKLLFALPYDNCEAHIREIMERGDYQMIMCRKGNGLEKKLEKCDLALIGRINLSKGKDGAANRKAILSAAKRGVGIVVLANPKSGKKEEGAKPLFEELVKKGSKEMPPFVSKPYLLNTSGHLGAQCFSYGKGRVVILPRPAKGYRDSLESVVSNTPPRAPGSEKKFPIHWGLYHGYEYTYQSMITMLDWAGKRDLGLQCSSMTLGGPEGKRKLRIPLNTTGGQSVKGTLQVRLRNLFNESVAHDQVRISLPSNGKTVDATLSLGAVPSGPHVAEWRLNDAKGQALSFGSQLVALDSEDKVSVALNNKNASYRAGDSISANITAKAGFKNAKVAYSVIDSYGREVAKGSIALDAEGKGKIDLPVLHNRAELHDLWVSLMDGKRTAAKTVQTFYIFPKTNPMDDDFFVVAWGPMKTGNVALRQIGARGAREAGIDYNHLTGDGDGNRDICYRSNGGLYSLLSKHFNFKSFKRDEKTRALTPSFAPDKDRAATMKADWQKRVRDAYTVGGAFYFGLDDERGMGWDMSEESIRQFRLWLADKYKTVQALNKSWATAYTSFDEVTGAEESPEFGPKANLAASLDRQAFHKYIWGNWYMRMPGLWAQEVVPGGSVGVAGTYGFSYDIPYVFGPWLNHTNYYPDGYKSEVYRSVGSNFEAGPYTGYKMSYNAAGASTTQRAMPWRVLFQGGQHVSYWELQTSSRHGYGVLQYDGTPSPGYRDLARDEWPDLKGGVGKLIIDREFVDSKIGFMHGFRYADPSKSVIEDLQRQHHVYLPSEIEAGELEKQGVKVLFMPAQRVVSDKLLKAVERFVGKGGKLVLILEKNRRPGEMDGQGHLRKDPTFVDRLCGVDFSKIRRHVGRGIVKAEGAGKDVAGIDQGMLRPSAGGLKAAGAEVLAKADVHGTAVIVWTRKKQGAGVVYLLNGCLNDYKVTQTGGVANETSTTISGPERIKRVVEGVYRTAIEDAGIPALFAVKQDSGAAFIGECYRFKTKGEKNGPVVFSFIPEATGDATITMPVATHLYDVRERKYIGKTANTKASLKAAHSKVWAALPYRVEAVKIESVPTQVKPGSLLPVKTNVVTDGKAANFAHTVRMLIQRRDSNKWVDLPAHSCNLSSTPATFEREFPIALNAVPGRYRILVRDILSGVEGTQEFEVSKTR